MKLYQHEVDVLSKRSYAAEELVSQLISDIDTLQCPVSSLQVMENHIISDSSGTPRKGGKLD